MMEKAVLETKRLMLRKMCREDQDSLNKMLQDPEVMYAYAHAFPIERQRSGWRGSLNVTGSMVSACGQLS